MQAGRITAVAGLVALLSGPAVELVMVLTAPVVATGCSGAAYLAGLIGQGAIRLLLEVWNGAQVVMLNALEAFQRLPTKQVVGGSPRF